jgi:hypothetical protein
VTNLPAPISRGGWVGPPGTEPLFLDRLAGSILTMPTEIPWLALLKGTCGWVQYGHTYSHGSPSRLDFSFYGDLLYWKQVNTVFSVDRWCIVCLWSLISNCGTTSEWLPCLCAVGTHRDLPGQWPVSQRPAISLITFTPIPRSFFVQRKWVRFLSPQICVNNIQI